VQVIEEVMSVSKEKIVEVGVLGRGRVQREKSEDAMVEKSQSRCDVEKTGKLVGLL
jgi:hypothetical protein